MVMEESKRRCDAIERTRGSRRGWLSHLFRSTDASFGALHLACAMGHVRAVETLLRYGADVSCRSHSQETGLHLCTDGAIARLLLERGADPNARCVGGYTPLHLCDDEDGVATELIAYGADVTKRTNGGSTPLHYVDTPNMVDLLVVKGGADINAINAYGHTPLHLCTSHGDWRTAIRLLRLGAFFDHRTYVDPERALSLRRRRRAGIRDRVSLSRRALTPVKTVRATIDLLTRSRPQRHVAEEIRKLRRCAFVLTRWETSMNAVSTSSSTTTRRRASRSSRARWGAYAGVARPLEREMIYGLFCGTWRTLAKTSPYEQLARGPWTVPVVLMRTIVEDYVGCEGFALIEELATSSSRTTRGLPKRLQQTLRVVSEEEIPPATRHERTRTPLTTWASPCAVM